MKFYETTAEEYIVSKEKVNLHKECTMDRLPKTLKTFENMIVYGPSGSGKYTQVLSFLKAYSPSELKYEKKMTYQSDKHTYIYRMSDIHYEIDMAFLGCNSKTVWHELFFQIVDIISVKPDKIGILVCKNFHMIHSELLEIFYSYMQRLSSVVVKYVIITEHISFLPNNILNVCATIPIRKPSKGDIVGMIQQMDKQKKGEKWLKEKSPETKRISSAGLSSKKSPDIQLEILEGIDTHLMLNLKEIQSFRWTKNIQELPREVFNVICDQIIQEMENIKEIPFTQFRDSLYDIMIYNLDVVECVWYILSHFIQTGALNNEKSSAILEKMYTFLKHYNNNYRPIYHLENIMFTMVEQIHYDKNDENRGTASSSIGLTKVNARRCQKGLS
jgi:hypothetical protein